MARLHDGLLIRPIPAVERPKGSNGIILPVGTFFRSDIYQSGLIKCLAYSFNGLKNREVGAALQFGMAYVNSPFCKNNIDDNLLNFYKNMRFSELLLSENRAAKAINWKLYGHSLNALESVLNNNDKLTKKLLSMYGENIPLEWIWGERQKRMTPGEKINEIFSAWLQLKSACKVKVSPYYKSDYDNVKKHAVLERLIAAKKMDFRKLAEQHAVNFLIDHGIEKSIFEAPGRHDFMI
jgi:hypothetical protein